MEAGMARHARFIVPGHPQHVIQRGNNRKVIFVCEEDFRFYLEKLEAACRACLCKIHAYILMTNHVHLLVTPETEESLGRMMQSLGRSYVQYFNYRYRRTGTLWEGRYKSTLLDSDRYLLTCYRYIELNPVRAGMVRDPGEYTWSSYHVNAYGGQDRLVQPHELYLRLANNREDRQVAYRALFKRHIDHQTLGDIRQATNTEWVLGDSRFKTQIEALLGRQVQPKPKGGDRKSHKYQKDR